MVLHEIMLIQCADYSTACIGCKLHKPAARQICQQASLSSAVIIFMKNISDELPEACIFF
jgi:hypothetical protein